MDQQAVVSDHIAQRQHTNLGMMSVKPIQTPKLDVIIARMDARLQVFAGTRDRREHFLLMYRTFKNELRTSIRVGRFVDAAWTEAICCRMAEMYFEAEEAYAADRRTCPIPWAHCFDSAIAGDTNLLQNMLLGMNAHINYDLPLCTYDTLLEFRDLDDASAAPHHVQLVFDLTLKRRYLDFLLINQVAWESIPLLQATLVDRFSRLLKIGNMLSLGVTKYAAEKIIVDYRDRAWGHTLLLATVRDADEVITINRLTTRFAMEAAALVARLTLNPVKFVRALSARGSRATADFSHDEVVRLLVTRLRSHPTSRVARRALVEYGADIHPILDQLLDENPGNSTLRVEVYKIMMQHPTPSTARALWRQLDPADLKNYDLALLYLDSLRRGGVQVAFNRQLIHTHIEQEMMRAKGYLDSFLILGPQGRGVLLGESLSVRFIDAIRRVLYLTSFLYAQQGLADAAVSLSHKYPTTPDGVVDLIERTLPEPERERMLARLGMSRMAQPEFEESADRANASARELCLAELARTEDPWLRVCAAHQLAELGLPSLGQPDALTQEIDMLSTIEKVLYLKNCELFRDIPGEDLAQVAGLAQSYRFKSREKLIEEGQPGQALFVILDGEIDVIVGQDRRVARLGRHAVLGEMSLLSDLPCSATCIALHAGRALRIGRADFLPFLLDYPEIATALLQVLMQRLRDVNQRVLEQSPAAAADYVALPGPRPA